MNNAHVPTSRRPRSRRGVCGRSKDTTAHVTPQASATSEVGDEKSPTYTLTLEALPSSLEPIARLRHLLKFALRALDLKCTDCRPVHLSEKTLEPGGGFPSTPAAGK